MPTDPVVEQGLAELHTFDQSLRKVQEITQTTTTAATYLKEAPDGLRALVDQGLRTGSDDDAELATRVAVCLERCQSRFQEGSRYLQTAMDLSEALGARSTRIQEAVAARDAAWPQKVACDDRVDELRSRSGPPVALEEKKARLQAKASADEVFKNATETARSELQGALASRSSTTRSIMAAHCRFYAALLADTEELVKDLNTLVTALNLAAAVPPVEVAAPAESLPGLLTSTAVSSGTKIPEKKPTVTNELPFAKGDSVQVWSEGTRAWLAGTVQEVYAESGVADGYRVSAGVLKVAHVQGVKYIRPEQIKDLLKRADES